MNPIRWMQPRDPRAAARMARALGVVAALMTVVLVPLDSDGHKGEALPPVFALASLIMIAAILVVARSLDTIKPLAWGVCPFIAVGVIALLNFGTYDASLANQIVFVFPTLYAASFLPRPGVAAITLASIGGVAIVALARLSLREGIVDVGYLSVGLVTTAVLLVRLTERQLGLVAKFADLASRDPLTGLTSRRGLEAVPLASLSQSAGDGGTALIVLDVDLFKTINDQYGHPSGDEVLVELAQRFTRMARPADIVCRIGGDEMAVLMPGCPIDIAARRAEELVQAVREHGFSLTIGTVIDVSISAGLAHDDTDENNLQALYASADAALYQAKRSGRDRFVAHAQ